MLQVRQGTKKLTDCYRAILFDKEDLIEGREKKFYLPFLDVFELTANNSECLS
jgi:hypothetical protein